MVDKTDFELHLESITKEIGERLAKKKEEWLLNNLFNNGSETILKVRVDIGDEEYVIKEKVRIINE